MLSLYLNRASLIAIGKAISFKTQAMFDLSTELPDPRRGICTRPRLDGLELTVLLQNSVQASEFGISIVSYLLPFKDSSSVSWSRGERLRICVHLFTGHLLHVVDALFPLKREELGPCWTLCAWRDLWKDRATNPTMLGWMTLRLRVQRESSFPTLRSSALRRLPYSSPPSVRFRL